MTSDLFRGSAVPQFRDSAVLLAERAAAYLQRFCVEITNRRTGSSGNRQATGFFAETIARFGFTTETPAFDCIDWECAGARLTVGGTPVAALVSPYSPGCAVRGPLRVVSTVDALAAADLAGGVVLLRRDLAAEPLMPKNFTFYNPEHHQRIVSLLEAKQPRAIIAATGRHPELAGGSYPFPLIEDGDFDIPSVYLTDVEGDRLAAQAGMEAVLTIDARRIPATGCNVVARKGSAAGPRVVLFAHIDAKDGTPGALDNATGVVTLLLLAELCASYTGERGLEIVALNGEDYYSAPGEQLYLRLNEGRFDEIVLGINIDGAGYKPGKIAYSLYGCPESITSAIQRAFAPYDDLVAGEPWYQGDHGLFLLHQRPALALTSEQLVTLVTEITHTSNDRPELVDCSRLASLALALRDLVNS